MIADAFPERQGIRDPRQPFPVNEPDPSDRPLAPSRRRCAAWAVLIRLPCFAWTTFATALNVEIRRRNRWARGAQKLSSSASCGAWLSLR